MAVLITCKNKEEPIKNEGARVVTTIYLVFFRHSRAANSIVSDGIGQKSKLIQAFMVVFILPARMKKVHPKMRGLEWSHHLSHYKSMGIFPDAQRQLTRQSLVRSYQISNPTKILLLSSLPARMKKI